MKNLFLISLSVLVSSTTYAAGMGGDSFYFGAKQDQGRNLSAEKREEPKKNTDVKKDEEASSYGNDNKEERVEPRRPFHHNGLLSD